MRLESRPVIPSNEACRHENCSHLRVERSASVMKASTSLLQRHFEALCWPFRLKNRGFRIRREWREPCLAAKTSGNADKLCPSRFLVLQSDTSRLHCCDQILYTSCLNGRRNDGKRNISWVSAEAQHLEKRVRESFMDCL